MKTLHKYFHIAVLVVTTTAAAVAKAGTYVNVSCRIDGHERTGLLYLPDGIKPQAPIVVCVHGYGGKVSRGMYGFEPVSDREGFAVFFPQGLRDPKGRTGFNVGYPSQRGMNVDDVKMLCKFTRHLQKKYNLSRHNAFLTGMSNGGDICYLAALEGQRTFSALAPVAGLTFSWFYEKYALSNPHPVPLFEIHGTQDHVSEWGGDPEGKGGWGPYISVPLAVGYWAARDRCTQEHCDTVGSKNPAGGHAIIRHRYTGGVNGCEVWLYEVVGAPHSWHDSDLDTAEEVWKFFKKYLK